MLKALIKMRRSEDATSAAVSFALAISVFTTLIAIFYIRSQKEADLGKTIYLITGDFKPYTGQSLAENGTLSAVVEATFRRMGYQAEFIFSPWEEGLNRLEASETDTEARAAFPFRLSPERQARFDYCEVPLLELESSLFYLQPPEPPTGGGQIRDYLETLPVILVSGYAYPESYQAQARKNGSISAPNAVEALAILLANDSPHVLLESTEVALQTVRNHFAGRTQYLRSLLFEDPEDRNPLFLLWARGNPNNQKLRQSFDRALLELKASGEYEEIFNRVNRELDSAWTYSIASRDPNANILAESARGRFVVPSGTLVVVERWGDAFYPAKEPRASSDFKTQIRFVTGPVAGSRATIDGETVDFHPTQ
ncbi:transporter substrate-binding domain-containing protein [Pelagicoccus sp. SDUM812003]|uniref:substrate-binding periplasmic protein n=1 Tax=Pelagicoccus sp. SDUM812003 TaxID=3041267 RepID=UPI00280F93B0|nr:transporter substrate-binding domain-containing protein [Pelagicoccus sp. SDUM812003]MDQ8204161.1 transporter substrate-binding domain-containing protein [Pelagicoccus sp. SDUM812003]